MIANISSNRQNRLIYRNYIEDVFLVLLLILLPFHRYVVFAGSQVNLSFADPVIALILMVLVPTSRSVQLPDLSGDLLVFLVSVILGMLILSLLSPLHFDTFEALLNIIKLSGSIAWFIAVAFLLIGDPPRRVRIATFVIIGVSGLITLLSVIDLLLGVSRVSGPFNNPNLYADYLTLSFYSCVYLYERSDQSTLITFGSLGLLGLFVITLIGTQSRAGLGAFIISFCLYIILKLWQRSWQVHLREVVLLSLSAILVFVAVLFSGIEINRYLGLLQSDVRTGGRLSTWRTLGNAFLQSPIVGIGLGQTENIVTSGIGPSTPHNTYIRFLSETGLIGFAALLIVIVKIIKSGFRSAVSSDTPTAPLFAYLCSSSFAGFFHGIINFRSLWVGIGIFTTLYYISADNRA